MWEGLASHRKSPVVGRQNHETCSRVGSNVLVVVRFPNAAYKKRASYSFPEAGFRRDTASGGAGRMTTLSEDKLARYIIMAIARFDLRFADRALKMGLVHESVHDIHRREGRDGFLPPCGPPVEPEVTAWHKIAN